MAILQSEASPPHASGEFQLLFRLSAPVVIAQLGMIMVGWLGVVELAAYQVVFNVATVTYMVPLGIAIGAATRVGNLIGEGRGSWLEQACRNALLMGGGLMRGMGRPRAGAIASMIGYYVFGLPLAALLAFHFELATAGILYGFSAGIGIVAAILGIWSMRTSRKPIDALLVARH